MNRDTHIEIELSSASSNRLVTQSIEISSSIVLEITLCFNDLYANQFQEFRNLFKAKKSCLKKNLEIILDFDVLRFVEFKNHFALGTIASCVETFFYIFSCPQINFHHHTFLNSPSKPSPISERTPQLTFLHTQCRFIFI